MLWEQAEIIRRNAVKLNNPDLLLDSRHQLYLRAIDVTIGTSGLDAKSHTTDEYSSAMLPDDRVTLNNIVEYVLSYLRARGPWSELEARKITKEKLQEYVSELIGAGLHTVEFPTLADTIRAAANYYGNDDLVERSALRVLELLSKPDFAAGLSEEALAEMRLDAEADLRRLGRPH
jgi:hypothetical protein